MRLIDADHLLERMKKDPLFRIVDRYGVSGVIETEPTIQLPGPQASKVYIITMGEYSDKYNFGITFDKEKAERYVERFNAENRWRDANIEVLEMDAWDDNRLTFRVLVKPDEVEAETTDYAMDKDINCVKPNIEYKGDWLHGLHPEQTGYYVYVKAKDKEHAIKTACDLIAMYKAVESERR